MGSKNLPTGSTYQDKLVARAAPATSTLTILGGGVSQSLTANGVLGSYEVMANAIRATAPAVFTLSNIPETYSIFLPLVASQP
mgnify:CR=1 FL=1